MMEREQRWHDVGEFIREQRRIGHLSLRKLSEMAGISNPYLSQIERGLRKPSAEILQQIARALEISSETLYVRAGILEERPEDLDLVAAIRRDPYVNEDQKKTLIHIYQSFAGDLPAFPSERAGDATDTDSDPGAKEVPEAASTAAAGPSTPADRVSAPTTRAKKAAKGPDPEYAARS